MDLRDKMTSPNRLRAYLRVEDYSVAQISEALKRCTQEGVIEFKRRMVNHLFSFISRLSRTTPSQSEVLDEEAHLRSVLLSVGIENLFAQGTLKPPEEAASPESASQPRMTVNEVFLELQRKIAENPEIGRTPLAKTILLDLQAYKKEFTAFSQLSPNISDDRAPAFFLNFKGRIDGITLSANNHFQELLAQEEGSKGPGKVKGESPLAISSLSTLLGTQAQELSRIRSTLTFAAEEGYKFRDILLRLMTKKEQVLALLDEEARVFQSKNPQGEPSNALALQMTRAMIDYYENHLLNKDGHPAR